MNRVAAITNALGHATIYEYDVRSNKTYEGGATYPVRYTYTDDVKLATRTWARGIVTTYAYDGWGKLIETAYSDNTPTVTLFYDAFNRQVEAHDDAGRRFAFARSGDETSAYAPLTTPKFPAALRLNLV